MISQKKSRKRGGGIKKKQVEVKNDVFVLHLLTFVFRIGLRMLRHVDVIILRYY